jgi:hypothetical protein
MKVSEIVLELRQGLSVYTRQQFPNWPEYVIKDLIYKGIKNMPSDEINQYIQSIKKEYPVKQWKLENLKITLEMFDSETQRKLNLRQGGSANPFDVPKDAERHSTQAAMIQKQGVSKEPIILIKQGSKYELLEGWHRTIQHFKVFPDGYNGPAWVGYI